jgi:hypothetical protein
MMVGIDWCPYLSLDRLRTPQTELNRKPCPTQLLEEKSSHDFTIMVLAHTSTTIMITGKLARLLSSRRPKKASGNVTWLLSQIPDVYWTRKHCLK